MKRRRYIFRNKRIKFRCKELYIYIYIYRLEEEHQSLKERITNLEKDMTECRKREEIRSREATEFLGTFKELQGKSVNKIKNYENEIEINYKRIFELEEIAEEMEKNVREEQKKGEEIRIEQIKAEERENECRTQISEISGVKENIEKEYIYYQELSNEYFREKEVLKQEIEKFKLSEQQLINRVKSDRIDLDRENEEYIVNKVKYRSKINSLESEISNCKQENLALRSVEIHTNKNIDKLRKTIEVLEDRNYKLMGNAKGDINMKAREQREQTLHMLKGGNSRQGFGVGKYHSINTSPENIYKRRELGYKRDTPKLLATSFDIHSHHDAHQVHQTHENEGEEKTRLSVSFFLQNNNSIYKKTHKTQTPSPNVKLGLSYLRDNREYVIIYIYIYITYNDGYRMI